MCKFLNMTLFMPRKNYLADSTGAASAAFASTATSGTDSVAGASTAGAASVAGAASSVLVQPTNAKAAMPSTNTFFILNLLGK